MNPRVKLYGFRWMALEDCALVSRDSNAHHTNPSTTRERSRKYRKDRSRWVGDRQLVRVHSASAASNGVDPEEARRPTYRAFLRAPHAPLVPIRLRSEDGSSYWSFRKATRSMRLRRTS